MAQSFSFNVSQILNNLAQLEPSNSQIIRTFVNASADKLQAYAKDNAKWTDRTGAARQRLNTKVEKVSNGYQIALAHGVDYGIYLEMAHEKRFAIIEDSLRLCGENEIMPALQNLLSHL